MGRKTARSRVRDVWDDDDDDDDGTLRSFVETVASREVNVL